MSSAGSYGAGGGGGVGNVKFLAGNDAIPVGPNGAGVINVLGQSPIDTVGDPTDNILTVKLTGTLVTSITGDAGSTGPVSGAVTLTGGSSGAVFFGDGANTITESFNFLALPNTDNPLTQGYISVNGTPILAFYGGVIRHNTFLGYLAGNAAISSTRNTGIGFGTLNSITSGALNTALGDNAAPFINTGNSNTALGQNAYNSGTDSNNNVAIGQNSLSQLTSTGGGDGDNTAVGTSALSGIVSGTNNIALGYNAGGLLSAADSSNIIIGNTGTSGISNEIIIGTQGSGVGEQDSCNIAGIYGSAVGVTNSVVFIDNTGQLGTTGGTFSAVTSIDGSTLGSVPISGALTITGGTSGAVFATAGTTITDSFDFLDMADSSSTTGYIQIGSTRVFNCGAGVAGHNTFVGQNAGNSTLSGTQNICIGDGPGASGAGAVLTSGSLNTGCGYGAFNDLGAGSSNTAFGGGACQNVTTGNTNTAVGQGALNEVTSGSNNIALGSGAGSSYTTGSESSNIVIGNQGVNAESNTIRIGTQGSGAGQQNKCNIAGIFGSTVGGTNSAVFIDNAGNLGTVGGSAGGVTSITGNSGGALTGALTLTGGTSGGTFTGSGTTLTMSFTSLSLPDTNGAGTNGVIKVNGSNVLAFYGGTSSANVLVGPLTGLNTMSGSHNTVVGDNALKAATSCNDNVAVGFRACQALTSGSSNIGIGTSSLGNASATTANQNVSIGHIALSGLLTGASNIAIGFQAGLNYTSSESSNILIGHAGVAAESNVIRIGDGATQTSFFTTGVAGVTVTSTAAVLVNTSTGQLGTIISSRRFKENIDDMGVVSRDLYKLRPVKFNFKGDYTESYGLIAEDVEEVMPYLVSYDKEGLPCTVKYHELPALLLNEIQRLKLKIDELEGKINARVR